MTGTAPSTRVDGRRRIVLIDPSVVGQSHLLANLGFIELCTRIFDDVVVLAEESHCEALFRYGVTSGGRVTLSPYSTRSREMIEQVVRDDRNRQIIFLNLEYRLFAEIQLRSRRRRGGRTTVRWVLHSHFAHSAAPSLRSKIKAYLKEFLLFRADRSASFIVYGSHIKSNLLQMLGDSVRPSQICSIIHPIGIPALANVTRPTYEPHTRIFFLAGWHSLPEETQVLISEIRSITESSRSTTFQATKGSIGHRADGSRVILSDYRDRMAQLKDADLVLYLPTNDYALQASGALMDSFVSAKPLIGISTDFQREIESLVGPIGFFFASAEQLKSFLRHVDERENFAEEVKERRVNLLRGHATIMREAEHQLRCIYPD